MRYAWDVAGPRVSVSTSVDTETRIHQNVRPEAHRQNLKPYIATVPPTAKAEVTPETATPRSGWDSHLPSAGDCHWSRFAQLEPGCVGTTTPSGSLALPTPSWSEH